MWKQIKSFDINKMGHKPGYCLQNVRLGFGIGSLFDDAKEDMLNNKYKGTLHPMSTLPKDIQVPVYVDSTSRHEHIIAYDRGTYYSDGKKLNSIKNINFFGWGELLENVRVVQNDGLKYEISDIVEVQFDIVRVKDDKGQDVLRENAIEHYTEIMVENGGYQLWLPLSLLKGNNFKARAQIIGVVGDKTYKMSVFVTPFDCIEKYIIRKL